MSSDELLLRRAIVFVSAFVYWVGVAVQARRIRRQIGRSPNVRPRGTKEKLLWAGWMVVAGIWLFQPFFVGGEAASAWRRGYAALLHGPSLVGGALLVATGYVGTLWCYAAMGDTWRMGINRKEKTVLVSGGPYQWVRHPIYLFQVVMLAGAAWLLPTWLSLIALLIHFVCVWLKALDEETYLLAVHGETYRDYLRRTGRLFPKLWGRSGPILDKPER
jgi:protein-S-isoprenylcysteine O-methyltransferase Ste14